MELATLLTQQPQIVCTHWASEVLSVFCCCSCFLFLLNARKRWLFVDQIWHKNECCSKCGWKWSLPLRQYAQMMTNITWLAKCMRIFYLPDKSNNPNSKPHLRQWTIWSQRLEIRYPAVVEIFSSNSWCNIADDIIKQNKSFICLIYCG